MKKYIAYLRVSTKGQERSGLGLEAQRAIIYHYAKVDNVEVVHEFIEAESGKDIDNRPMLSKAIASCLDQKHYYLIVAKLDRLSRDVKDTFDILEKVKGKFISCDIPTQNGVLDTFTLAVFAGLAQRERELISIRTKAALQAKKNRGAKLGKPENFTNETRAVGASSTRQKALKNLNNRLASALIERFDRELHTLQQIADELNSKGFRTSKGRLFHPTTVKRLIERRRFPIS
ncbi:recombinase family protein [Flectobacillus major]|jgi:DNA invertase Pin-like site-specific DNA recombinase|uniref:recombinase family protein n=1 Tax=Flectobacillus major TaxID=103 RepID=UPI000427986E|nr:recombinase family protein [Flectobacillus major]